MSATGSADDGPAAGNDDSYEDSVAAHAYFRSLEEVFIRLRGAPLLLSPADHLLARQWYEESIPLEVVSEALEGLFERRRERGSKNRVSSLRYCRPAVEREWERVRELRIGATRTAAPTLDISTQLAALVDSLPATLPNRTQWAEKIGAVHGTAEAAEEALAALDRELMDALDRTLDEDGHAELTEAVGKAIAGVALRLTEDELRIARERLRRQMVRQRFSVPLLTLFEG